MAKLKLTLFLASGVLICLVICWIAGGVLVSPARATMPPAPVGADSVTFESGSGSSIKGWYFKAPAAVSSMVLMHGVRGNRTDLTERANLFQDLGFDVLTFDLQAHGESSGDAITFGALESLDAIAAVDFARARQPDKPLVVVAISLGGAASLLAGSRLDADVLIVESVYSDIEQAVANRLNLRIPYSGALSPLLLWQLGPRLGIDASELSPVSAASQLSFPTLVLSGSDDQHTLMWEAQAIYDAIPTSKGLHVFEGASHQNLHRFDPDGYRKVVVDFICASIQIPACV